MVNTLTNLLEQTPTVGVIDVRSYVTQRLAYANSCDNCDACHGSCDSCDGSGCDNCDSCYSSCYDVD